jgi:hypothetical protein
VPLNPLHLSCDLSFEAKKSSISSTSVTAEVSGSFEGSLLKMRFNLEVSSNKIQSLESEVL